MVAEICIKSAKKITDEKKIKELTSKALYWIDRLKFL
jgi:hypothetical protein